MRYFWNTVDRVFLSALPMEGIDRPLLRVRHGPGAVADLKTGKDKYQFPFWPSKLERSFPRSVHAQHVENLHLTEDVIIWNGSRKEPPAKLLAVPKTLKGPRLITSEPTAHQFLQQGLNRWIRDNLSPAFRTSIDFSSQEPSRLAALSASQDGNLATVDLSSASDRLSCWAIERAFGKYQDLLECLHACRTRVVVDGTGTQQDLSILLKKFAGQGSAVTFPIQTIFYAGIAIACVLCCENKVAGLQTIKRAARKVRVFGDDIILPRKCVPLLTKALDELELKVNESKTHTSGHFRESCGMDAYKGYDVTPGYVSYLSWDKSPDRIASWIQVSNNFHHKGLWSISSYMRNSVPIKYQKRILTCRMDGDGYRLFTFCKGYLTRAKVRYSQHLHRYEANLLSSRSIAIVESRMSWDNLLQYFVEAPDSQSKWVAGYVTKNTSKVFDVWASIGDLESLATSWAGLPEDVS